MNMNSDQLYKLRHSLAHILAEAVLQLRPDAKLGFGPPVDNGFYYDFDFGEESITEEDEDDALPGMAGNGESGDSLYDQAVAIVLRDGKASTSYVQRRLSIGYNRAATLIERMEEEGVISAANHAGKREILVGDNAS